MNTQIFISYRRNTGLYLAKSIADCLQKQGYNVFFDYSSMRNGQFNTQIFNAIDSADDILFVWSEQALHNCSASEDWVRKELLYAQSRQKHIIVIKDGDNVYEPEAILPDFLFLKEATHIGITLSNFKEVIKSLNKILKAQPVSRFRKIIKRQKISLLAILLISGIVTAYIKLPIPTKEIIEDIDSLRIHVPKEFIDITDYIDKQEEGFICSTEPNVVYADRKNYNEVIGVSVDSDDLDPTSLIDEMTPEETFVFVNNLPDKSILKKEVMNLQDYADCIKASCSLVPQFQDSKIYIKRIEEDDICFFEFAIQEKQKIFKYKMGLFFKPDEVLEDEYTMCIVIVGCSKNVNKFRQMRLFNTVNYIIKKILQENSSTSKKKF